MRFGFNLHRLVLETDPDRMHVIDTELDSNYGKYNSIVAEAIRLSPAHAGQIASAAAAFDQAVLDSRPIRTAALANDNNKARVLLRAGVDVELQLARQPDATRRPATIR